MFRRKLMSRTLAAAFLASGMAMVLATGVARAEDMSTQQIIDGLSMSKPRATRGLSMAAPVEARPETSAADLAFINRIRSQSRSLSMTDREQMAAIAPKRKKIDLEINFEYNSAALSSTSLPQLNKLGAALTGPELAGSVMMLGGYTDARGSDDYNQQLSERRAETVKRFLMQNYHIPAANLVSAGYGKKGLKNTADPFAAENRRVEVVNMAEREQVSR